MMEQDQNATLTSTSREGGAVVVVKQQVVVTGTSATSIEGDTAEERNKEEIYATDEQIRAVFSNGVVS